MTDEKEVNPGKDREKQQARKAARMADPEKNKQAASQKALDDAGRDWSKPKFHLKDGEV